MVLLIRQDSKRLKNRSKTCFSKQIANRLVKIKSEINVWILILKEIVPLEFGYVL